jgi:hypothetical protein
MTSVWGCVKNAQMSIPPFEEIENGIHYRYWNCPSKFVPDSVEGFYMIYRYHKDFPSAVMPPLSLLSARFFLAYRYYESKFNECKMQMLETK